MSDGLFTNRSAKKDFVQNALVPYMNEGGRNIYIAVAYFTEHDSLSKLVKGNNHLRIVLGLKYPTNPLSLEQIIKLENVEVRYFTSQAFHPKLYIFGQKEALVGSANLTKHALLTNQEVVVSIPSDDPRFGELACLFSDFWSQAKVLDAVAIEKYKAIYNRHQEADKLIANMGEEVQSTLGNVVYANINRGPQKETEQNIFIDDYRKNYQECVGAFQVVLRAYQGVGKRKVPEELIPLRMEIDSFFSFVRDTYAKGDSYLHQPILSRPMQESKIQPLVGEWLETSYPHFENQIVKVNYPKIKRWLSTPETIQQASIDELFDVLCVIHSFHDRFRFYPGGLEGLKGEFFAKNELSRIKDCLSYLLHGEDEIIVRMANLIFNEKYKLNVFGRSNVQEIVGWCNNDNLPVVNGRTTKVLRYLGFEVEQLD
ncbi:MAG: phospholipase D family protein [Nitrospirales bacterium]